MDKIAKKDLLKGTSASPTGGANSPGLRNFNSVGSRSADTPSPLGSASKISQSKSKTTLNG